MLVPVELDVIAVHSQELPRGPGADDTENRTGTFVGARITDPRGIHRGDTLTKSSANQVVLGLDHRDKRCTQDVLTATLGEDEVAVTIQTPGGVNIPLDAEEQRDL